MKIYLYDKNTLEYIKSIEAEADPEETRIQGHFIPLLPACSTLIEPPKFNENEIPVFNGESWVIYPDFRGKFYKVNANLLLEEINNIGISEGEIIVSKEIGEEILANPDLFKIIGTEVVRKTSEELALEQFNQRREKFESDFFHTSLGYIRRKVMMKNGQEKDFLGDLLLPIKTGLEIGQEIKIITYKLPDFSQEMTNEYLESLQEIKIATVEFVQECLSQIVSDFGI